MLSSYTLHKELVIKTASRNQSVLVRVLFGGVCLVLTFLYSPCLSPGFTWLKALSLSARCICGVSGLSPCLRLFLVLLFYGHEFRSERLLFASAAVISSFSVYEKGTSLKKKSRACTPRKCVYHAGL